MSIPTTVARADVERIQAAIRKRIKDLPYCFGSDPNPSGCAENCCDMCPAMDMCLLGRAYENMAKLREEQK
jgi:hypothetical protein